MENTLKVSMSCQLGSAVGLTCFGDTKLARYLLLVMTGGIEGIIIWLRH